MYPWAPRLRLLWALQKRHTATKGGGHQTPWWLTSWAIIFQKGIQRMGYLMNLMIYFMIIKDIKNVMMIYLMIFYFLFFLMIWRCHFQRINKILLGPTRHFVRTSARISSTCQVTRFRSSQLSLKAIHIHPKKNSPSLRVGITHHTNNHSISLPSGNLT